MKQFIREAAELTCWYTRRRFWKRNWHRMLATWAALYAGLTVGWWSTGYYWVGLLTAFGLSMFVNNYTPLINPDTGKRMFTE